MLNTPVLFLIFNRPDTTKKVFEKIREAKPKQLFIAADGPRIGNIDDIKKCEEVRKIVAEIDWECDLKVLFREQNLGCMKSVSLSIEWFFQQVEVGIVLEDDCLPENTFFGFCEKMLLKYKDDHSVGAICGMNHLYSGINSLNDEYFLSPLNSVWGWASWARVIKEIEWDPEQLKPIIDINYFHAHFQQNKNISNWMHSMIESTFAGKIDTWDTIFAYNLILKKMLNILPLKNQVSNIGIVGTHAHGNHTPNLYSKTYSINLTQLNKSANDNTYNKIRYANIEKLIMPPKLNFILTIKHFLKSKLKKTFIFKNLGVN